MPTCPNCKTGHLVRSERSGSESNYCPDCRSWIDDETLRAQAERDTAADSPKRPPPPPAEDAEVKKNM